MYNSSEGHTLPIVFLPVVISEDVFEENGNRNEPDTDVTFL